LGIVSVGTDASILFLVVSAPAKLAIVVEGIVVVLAAVVVAVDSLFSKV
jgi:hypothetical protein